MIYQFLANGFEDIEALAPVDILRRGGLNVKTVSINATDMVASAHGVQVKADMMFAEADFSDADLLMLPGGMPAAKTLLNCDLLRQALVQHNHKGTLLAAICAAPMVLGEAGVLKGKEATCYPGLEPHLHCAKHLLGEMVVEDENVITACGPAAAEAFAFTIARRLVGNEKVEEARRTMQYKKL